MKLTELYKLGLEIQANKFAETVRKIQEEDRLDAAKEWSKMGVVNYSFFERPYNNTITDDLTVRALAKLGIDYGSVKGKKWYQFWLNDKVVKFVNAIKLIPNTDIKSTLFN
jgi:hypothetical protein